MVSREVVQSSKYQLDGKSWASPAIVVYKAVKPTATSGLTISNVKVQTLQVTKADICGLDFEDSNNVLNLVKVTPEPPPPQSLGITGAYPRVLCFVNTISVHHETRAQAVAETWGQRCDKLMFFSNMSDTIVLGAGTSEERRYEVVPLDVPSDHDHLWQKHKATLQYLYMHFRHDFDWIYKADDDAYVVMENLRNYLRRPEILQAYKREPMQMGHRFNLPDHALNFYVKNDTLRELWHSRWDHMVYNSGGPGYIMNQLYLEMFVNSIPDWTCLSDSVHATVPDDAAISFCMMWHDVYPWDTRDYRGRERWHAFSPSYVFQKWEDPNSWYVQYHEYVGGLKSGLESAAPDSVAFHYVKPPMMYHVERTLYLCRAGDDIPDLASFNQRFQLTLGGKVMMR